MGLQWETVPASAATCSGADAVTVAYDLPYVPGNELTTLTFPTPIQARPPAGTKLCLTLIADSYDFKGESGSWPPGCPRTAPCVSSIGSSAPAPSPRSRSTPWSRACSA